jgi:uncharacterized UPF0160 family protein
MVPATPRPLLVTHGGKFHCDEVFAYAVLRVALGLSRPGEDHTLLRTREPELIASGDIVWDVGSIFDPAASRFDHHQRGAPLRPDQTPFSSAGLIWQVYGERAVAALLAPKGEPQFAAAIAAEMDKKLVRRLDEIDTGVALAGPVSRDALNLAALLGDFNPAWDSPEANGPAAGDAAFMEATAMAARVLANRVESARAKHQAQARVLAAFGAAEDQRLLVLETGMPWKNAVFSHELPVIFCVSPASNGNWMVDTMPPEPGSFAQRLPLPEEWAGLETAALAEVSGVEDAVFVHLRRFVGAAKSRNGAIEMARKALALAA